MKNKTSDKAMTLGEFFNNDKKIEIVINVPNEIYLRDQVQYRPLDFIKRVLKNEVDLIDNFNRNNNEDILFHSTSIRIVK